jgi:GNAT superfamily N-acetyltransferase
MRGKVFKITEIDDNLINLYIDCFKKYLIFNQRITDAIKDEKMINDIFECYIKYGTILAIKWYSKKVSFLTAFDIKKLYSDSKAFNLIFNKNLFPEIYNFLKQKDFDCNYIVLLGVDKHFRNRGMATKLVKHYFRYYKTSNFFITDVDNKYSFKIFKKFKFKNIMYKDNSI